MLNTFTFQTQIYTEKVWSYPWNGLNVFYYLKLFETEYSTDLWINSYLHLM